MSMKISRRQVLLSGLGVMGSLSVNSLSAFASENDNTIFQRNGFAIDGYDTVAYFTQNDAIAGNADFIAQYKGANWIFASAENRDKFISTPEKYAPQYEGYCAYAAAQGSVAKIEPDQWKIVEGKLYLNYNFLIKVRWEASQDDFIKDGNAKWPTVRPGIKTGRPL